MQQSPKDANGSTGQIETCTLDSHGSLFITGWAWLPDRNYCADRVIIGYKDTSGNFKPICIMRTGARREDLRKRLPLPTIEKAGFSRTVNSANLPAGDVMIEGWAIDLKEQKAWPLASSLTLKHQDN